MVIARTLLNLWSWELDQIDSYDVPELFRGVPGTFLKNDFLEVLAFENSNFHFFDL